MKIGYLEVVEVKKIRSRSVCQLIVEADISQFKNLVSLDETKGVFIPCKIEGAVCGALDMDLDPEELQALMSATAQPGVLLEQKPEKGKSLAQRMVIAGYFRNEKLWDALEAAGTYTQDQHREHVLEDVAPINAYPSQARTGPVVAHHVRTAANSGTGIKPPHWFCLPLYDSHHKYLHNNATREERAEHLVWAVDITAKAMREAFKRFEKIESMTGYTDAQLLKAENKLGITTPFTMDVRKAALARQ